MKLLVPILLNCIFVTLFYLFGVKKMMLKKTLKNLCIFDKTRHTGPS